jgi:hypothetical protein
LFESFKEIWQKFTIFEIQLINMKKQYLLTLALLLVGTGILTSNPDGPSGDFTGAPLSNGNAGSTCAASGCHTGSTNNGCNVNIEVTDKGGSTPVSAFKAGSVYTVKVTVGTSITNGQRGFQASILSPTHAKSGVMSSASSGAKLRTLGTREFCMQSTPSTSGVWFFDWTAPSASVPDSVIIYACGNATNGNGNTAGDDVKTTKMVLKKEAASSVTTTIQTLKLSPNPALETIQLGVFAEYCAIIGIDGKVIAEVSMSQSIYIADLAPGIYYMKASSGTQHYTGKFQKL